MQLFTTNDVAELFDVSHTTVRRWIKAKKISYHKFGRTIKFTQSDIDDFIEKSKVPKKTKVGEC